ncbi:MAG: AraC family transcriptional regulator [Anaerolineales bacterium]|nr:AraC family transcriptional regulator [Chloroflexota bacterium]MBL6982686.1 AraC family transcriptional regulator [Anaerolineales bacterium]
MSDPLFAIKQAIDFVEENLQDEIVVADMASAAGYSLFHFVRTFNKVVHHTPYDYLMRRRLSEAADALVSSDRRIIDIALEYCFHSSEVFSRAFKRMFGIQPSQYRTGGFVDPRFAFSPKTLPYLQHINRGDFLAPALIQRDAVTVMGLMTRVAEGRQDIQQLWDSPGMEISNLAELSRYGITTYPGDWVEKGAFYLAAVAMNATDIAGHTLVTRTFPAGDYAAFKHEGSLEDLAYTRDFIYQSWLPKSGRRLAYPLEIECYGENKEDNTPNQVLISIESL